MLYKSSSFNKLTPFICLALIVFVRLIYAFLLYLNVDLLLITNVDLLLIAMLLEFPFFTAYNVINCKWFNVNNWQILTNWHLYSIGNPAAWYLYQNITFYTLCPYNVWQINKLELFSREKFEPPILMNKIIKSPSIISFVLQSWNLFQMNEMN